MGGKKGAKIGFGDFAMKAFERENRPFEIDLLSAVVGRIEFPVSAWLLRVLSIIGC